MLNLNDDRILFAGDWHGNIRQAAAVLQQAYYSGIKTVIQLGDFGVDDTRWGKEFLDDLQRILQTRDMIIYFVDGNHEKFPHLYTYPTNRSGVRPLRERVFHLPRGLVFTWRNIHVLALGGAYSIDKDTNRSWSPEEEITDSDVNLALNSIGGFNIDLMLCHDSPSDAPNIVTDSATRQEAMGKRFGLEHIVKADSHRKQLNKVYVTAQPSLVIHGHYHTNFTLPAPYGAVQCLHEGGATMTEHTAIYSPQDIVSFKSQKLK